MKRFVCFLLLVLLTLSAAPFSVAADAPCRGDVNRDGSITAADATMVLRYVVSMVTLDEDQLHRADADASGGTPTSSDAAKILRCVIGSETITPCTHGPRYTYVLDTDGIDVGADYLIVLNNGAALRAIGDTGSTQSDITGIYPCRCPKAPPLCPPSRAISTTICIGSRPRALPPSDMWRAGNICIPTPKTR